MRQQGLFTEIDFSLAEYLSEKLSGPVFLKDLICLLNYRLRQGHSCLNLKMPGWSEEELPMLPLSLNPWPEFSFFKKELSGVAGNSDAFEPLILDGDVLYFHRFFYYEKHLADLMFFHAKQESISVDEDLLSESVKKYFPYADIDTDDQAQAAILALRSPVFLLCGGPGTGKTTTVVKLLCMILEQNMNVDFPRVALSAPTGKAAMRLKESFEDQLQVMDSMNAERINKSLRSVGTLHRLLKINPLSGKSEYGREYKLPIDILIVDECSMIDLSLMWQLMESLPHHARLILLGDPEQLASVEVGSIFSDLVSAATENGFPAMFTLKKNYRFSEDSGIGKLCAAIHGKNISEIKTSVENEFSDLKIMRHPKNTASALETMLEAWRAFFDSEDPETALNMFSSFRILCVTYDGKFGVRQLNAFVSDFYCKEKNIKESGMRFFHRMPVLITENGLNTGLFNGEIGVVWESEDGSMRVFFSGKSGELRSFSLQQLPSWTLAWAMTIHRSQGSEFNHVLMILPDQWIGILSRELIYTGLSRARNYATIWSKKEIVLRALEKPVARASGLAERLGRGK